MAAELTYGVPWWDWSRYGGGTLSAVESRASVVGAEPKPADSRTALPGVPVSLAEWVPMLLEALRDAGVHLVRPSELAGFLRGKTALVDDLQWAIGEATDRFAGASLSVELERDPEDPRLDTVVVWVRLAEYPDEMEAKLREIRMRRLDRGSKRWRVVVDTDYGRTGQR